LQSDTCLDAVSVITAPPLAHLKFARKKTPLPHLRGFFFSGWGFFEIIIQDQTEAEWKTSTICGQRIASKFGPFPQCLSGYYHCCQLISRYLVGSPCDLIKEECSIGGGQVNPRVSFSTHTLSGSPRECWIQSILNLAVEGGRIFEKSSLLTNFGLIALYFC
jgi:hypothetical protein